MTVIAQSAAGSLRSLLPTDSAVAHASLKQELERNLSPSHAALFATPEVQADGSMVWHTDVPGEPFSYYELDRESQGNLLGQVGRRISDIRRHIEGMHRAGDPRAPSFENLLRAAVEIPAIDRVYAIGQQPVLAGWGHVLGKAGVPGALLSKYDDGISLPIEPRRPWEIWGLTAGVLLGLATLIYFLGPRLPLAAVSLPHCSVDGAQLALLQQLLDVRGKGHDDSVDLAAVLNQADAKRANCPLPAPPPPKAPPPPLPEKSWENQDLTMLKGCWDRTSNMTVSDVRTHKVSPVKSWKMCFDEAGHGTDDLIFEDGTTCGGALTARFTGPGDLQLADNGNVSCSNESYVYRSVGVCHRLSDEEAECNSQQPQIGKDNIIARFHRPAGQGSGQ